MIISKKQKLANQYGAAATSFLLSVVMILSYLLPTQYILEQHVEQQSKRPIKSLTAKRNIDMNSEDLDASRVSLRENVYVLFDGVGLRFRRDTFVTIRSNLDRSKLQRAKIIYLYDGKRSVTFANSATPAETSFPKSELFLLTNTASSSQTLAAILQRQGYELSTQRLARLGNAVVYELGGDRSKNAWWYDIQSMLPIGYSFNQGRYRSLWDGQPLTRNDGFFPREQRILIDDQAIETRKSSGVRVNAGVPLDTFNIDKIAKNFKPAEISETNQKILEDIIRVRSDF